MLPFLFAACDPRSTFKADVSGAVITRGWSFATGNRMQAERVIFHDHDLEARLGGRVTSQSVARGVKGSNNS